MWNNVIRTIKNQAGFTAIEMVIGVAIIAIISVATATAVTQVFTGSNTSSNQMTAISNVRNAGDWITRDAQEAQAWKSNIGAGSLEGSTMTLVWYEYDYDPAIPDPNKVHQISYTIPVGSSNLVRAEVGGHTIVVAQKVIATRTFISMTDKNFLQLIISSTVGSGKYQVTEQRKFEIRLRPER